MKIAGGQGPSGADLVKLTRQAQAEGAAFTRERRWRWPWQDKFTAAEPEEVVQRLENRPLKVQPADAAVALPLNSVEDLQEVAAFSQGKGGELPQKSLGQNLQTLSEAGWRFWGSLEGQQVEVGLYGAYNALTEAEPAISDLQMGRGELKCKADAGEIEKASGWAPANEEQKFYSFLETRGFCLIKDDRRVPLYQLSDEQLHRARLTCDKVGSFSVPSQLDLTRLADKCSKNPEAVMALVEWRAQQLGQPSLLEVAKEFKEAVSSDTSVTAALAALLKVQPDEKHPKALSKLVLDAVEAASKQVGSSTETLQKLARLAQKHAKDKAAHLEQGVKLAAGMKPAGAAKTLKFFLEHPELSAQQSAEFLWSQLDGSYVETADRVAVGRWRLELLAKQPETAKAGQVAERLLTGADSPYESEQILDAIFRSPQKKTLLDFAPALSNLAGSHQPERSQRLVQAVLAEHPETAPTLGLVSKLAAQMSPQARGMALQAALGQPGHKPHQLMTELWKVLDQRPAETSDRLVVGRWLLSALAEKSETATAGEIGQVLIQRLESDYDKEAVAEMVLAKPEAGSVLDYAASLSGLSGHYYKQRTEIFTDFVLERHPETRDSLGVVKQVAQSLTADARTMALKTGLFHPAISPVKHMETLWSVLDQSPAETADRVRVGEWLIDNLVKNPETAAAGRVGRLLCDRLPGAYDREAVIATILRDPEKKTLLEFARELSNLCGHYYLERARVLTQTMLEQHPETEAGLGVVAGLAGQMGKEAQAMALQRGLKEPAAPAGQLVRILWSALDQRPAETSDRIVAGKWLLEELGKDPETSAAAEVGRALLAELPSAYDQEAVLNGVLATPKKKSMLEFAPLLSDLSGHFQAERGEKVADLLLKHHPEADECLGRVREMTRQMTPEARALALRTALKEPLRERRKTLETLWSVLDQRPAETADRVVVGRQILAEMMADPQTVAAARVGQDLLAVMTNAYDVEAILTVIFAAPQKQSLLEYSKELSGLAGRYHTERSRKIAEVMQNQHPETRKGLGEVRRLAGQMTEQAEAMALRTALETPLDSPEELVRRLWTELDQSPAELSDRMVVGRWLVDHSEQPGVRFARELLKGRELSHYQQEGLLQVILARPDRDSFVDYLPELQRTLRDGDSGRAVAETLAVHQPAREADLLLAVKVSRQLGDGESQKLLLKTFIEEPAPSLEEGLETAISRIAASRHDSQGPVIDAWMETVCDQPLLKRLNASLSSSWGKQRLYESRQSFPQKMSQQAQLVRELRGKLNKKEATALGVEFLRYGSENLPYADLKQQLEEHLDNVTSWSGTVKPEKVEAVFEDLVGFLEAAEAMNAAMEKSKQAELKVIIEHHEDTISVGDFDLDVFPSDHRN